MVAAYGSTRGRGARDAGAARRRRARAAAACALELASTALVGLGEGARYLVDVSLRLRRAARLGGAGARCWPPTSATRSALPGIEPAKLKDVAARDAQGARGLPVRGRRVRATGRASAASPSPYLTSYVLHVLQRGRQLGHPVTPGVLEKAATTYLEERARRADRPTNEGWWPAYTAWQAFAVQGAGRGRPQRGQPRHAPLRLPRPHAGLRARLPARRDARASGETGARAAELRAPHPQRDAARGRHPRTSRSCPIRYLLWFWNSNVRSTAIVLGALVAQRRRRGARSPAWCAG